MQLDLARTINGKKFMWDGETYQTEIEAGETMSRYIAEGFETEQVIEDERYLLFTRRVVNASS